MWCPACGGDPSPADSGSTGASAGATTGAGEGTGGATGGVTSGAMSATSVDSATGTGAASTGPDGGTRGPGTTGATGGEVTTTTTTSDGGSGDAGSTGEAPPPAMPCTSVSQLANPNGLTDAMRQTSGVVTGPLLPPGSFSLLEYVTLFGTSANTYPPEEPDPTGFGYPGTDQNRLTFTLERDKYVSLQFRAPTADAWYLRTGSLGLIPAGAFVSAAIARCPGQFADDPAWPMPPGCSAFGESAIPWNIGGPGCTLEPGVTYYVNVINASLAEPTMTACVTDTCKFKLMNKHIDP